MVQKRGSLQQRKVFDVTRRQSVCTKVDAESAMRRGIVILPVSHSEVNSSA